MKRFTLLFSALVASAGLSAQTFVSTSPANKNVVLEEYTGIYCVYCPDGHRLGKQLSDNNPGRVVLINIHTGGYANPNGSDPDFRTGHGDAVAGHADVKISGYPAGSVNRRSFPNSQNGGTASSRGNWATDGGAVMGEASVVNVAAKADYNDQTGEIDIVVEAYYTGAGSGTDYLNVGILQNNVPGPQTGGATYNPSNMLPNGDYNHQHMLRASLTGDWGVSIDTTTAGTFVSKTYSWKVPADINGIPVEVHNLEVYAFMADNQQDILTGAVTQVTLPANITTDLSMTANSALPADMCTYKVTPEVTITNEENNAVTSFDVSYGLSGTSGGMESWTGSLAKGQSATIKFQEATVMAGASTLSYSAPNNINMGALLDINSSNAAIPSENIYTVNSAAVGTSFSYDFEGLNTGTEVPGNAYLMNEGGLRVFVVTNAVTNPPLSWQLGGHGKSDGCYRFDLPTWSAGDQASIYFDKVDLSGMNGSLELSFDLAYAGWDANSNARIKVEASTDCGKNWTILFNKDGDDIETAADLNGQRFYPQPNQWQTHTGDANALKGSSEVIFKVTVSAPNVSNAMYLDNLMITEKADQTSIAEVSNKLGINVYPNPAVNEAKIDMNLQNGGDVALNVYDLTGKRVMTATENVVAGSNTLTLNTSSLEAGIYNVEIVTAEGVAVERVVLEK
ncbi:Omp28-related outer membrane protein [bacterium SCSIO 12741]|nr:Omp28-related outer membrane protein [bacterium SCSIO 12741]